MRKKIVFFLLLAISITAFSQIAPRQWRDYLPYRLGLKVAIARDKVYCLTYQGLFYYNTSDNTISTISKIQGLSDIDIATIEYSEKYNVLIVAYKNSNIDFIKGNQIINYPVIKNKINIEDKYINNISIFKDKAYLACNFGISIIDLSKLEIKETYYPSSDGNPNKVNDVSVSGDTIFAATATGIFYGDANDPFLVDFSRWKKFNNFSGTDKECKSVKHCNNTLFALYNTPDKLNMDSIMYFKNGEWNKLNYQKEQMYTINSSNGYLLISGWKCIARIDKDLKIDEFQQYSYPTYATYDKNGNLWYSDWWSTLCKYTLGGAFSNFYPESPYYPVNFKVACSENVLWAIAGGVSSGFLPVYNSRGGAKFENNKWQWFEQDEKYGEVLKQTFDVIDVAINPADEHNAFFASFINKALIEYNHGDYKFYDNTNSVIKPLYFENGDSALKVSSLSFDKSGNLWFSNIGDHNHLCVYTKDKKWMSYPLDKQTYNQGMISKVLATSWGHVWVVYTRSSKVIVFKHNGTLFDTDDDDFIEIPFRSVEGFVQPNAVYSLAEDKDGNIWMGTDAGVILYSYASQVFEEGGIFAQKPLVPLNDGTDNAIYLLENERVNSIFIDGGNRKWFGTQSSGAFLMSPDGTSQIQVFNTNNSPLFSNTILNITASPKSGEVFFSTSNGLVSYGGNSNEGGDDFGKVYAYPNPVRETYTGDIHITGLVRDASVKITDVAGNLVYETKAQGGLASWSGKNLLGNRVKTGVYLVFCSNSDGSKTYVTKILVIH